MDKRLKQLQDYIERTCFDPLIDRRPGLFDDADVCNGLAGLPEQGRDDTYRQTYHVLKKI